MESVMYFFTAEHAEDTGSAPEGSASEGDPSSSHPPKKEKGLPVSPSGKWDG